MDRPLIQIDDEIREMTEDEYDTYVANMGTGTVIQEDTTE